MRHKIEEIQKSTKHRFRQSDGGTRYILTQDATNTTIIGRSLVRNTHKECFPQWIRIDDSNAIFITTTPNAATERPFKSSSTLHANSSIYTRHRGVHLHQTNYF